MSRASSKHGPLLAGAARRTIAFAGLVLAFALPASGTGQEVAARAYVTPGTTVAPGAPFVLNLEVSGTQQLDAEPEIPDLQGFAQYLGTNTQTSMRVVNGQRAISVTVQYRYQALTEGSFEIPSFEVEAGGRTLSTEPIPLSVSARATAAPGAASGAGEVGPDDLFITTDVSKRRVHDGEPLVVEYRIWTRVDVSQFSFTRVPEPAGFWVEDITPQGQPAVEQRTRDGEQYATAVIRRVALVPTGAGERTIEPIVLEAQVRVRRDDPFDRFFGGRSLFGGGTVAAGVVSEPITITVDPLPAGAPDPFSGIVGSLELTASLDRDSVDANGAVTLTVRASGDGNVRAIPEPVLGLASDFEVFPPEVSETMQPFGAGLTGSKTFEYILIPRAPGRREIPAITMSYLDESTERYRVASTQPLPLTVSGDAPAGPGSVARGGVAQLREDIRFIHLGATLRPTGGPLLGTAGFWIVALLPLVGIVGALGLRRHRDRIEGDVAYARGRQAGRVAKKRLAEARKLAGEAEARPFYAELARAVRGLVADKLNLPEAGLRIADVDTHLTRRGVDRETRTAVTSFLEACDRQRFAPLDDDAAERGRFLDQAASLMTAVDREL